MDAACADYRVRISIIATGQIPRNGFAKTDLQADAPTVWTLEEDEKAADPDPRCKSAVKFGSTAATNEQSLLLTSL
jgi:hypothetical protein